MATLFPDRHFHVGGDEISGADWKANSRVQEFMKINGLMTLGELESSSSTACGRAWWLTATEEQLAITERLIGAALSDMEHHVLSECYNRSWLCC